MIPIGALTQTGRPATSGATLDQPLEHLSACHRRIEERLATLERAAHALESQREEALRAVHSAFAFLEGNGALHTQDEEVSLFPRLRGKLPPEQAAMVASLELDHELAHQLGASIKLAVAQIEANPEPAQRVTREFSDLVTRFCALYRRHIEVEDAHLIACSRAVLNEGELALIAQEMKHRRGL